MAKSCPLLCHPMDCTVHGILQARILEWVVVPFSRDLPNPGIKPRSPALQADSLLSKPPGKPWLRIFIVVRGGLMGGFLLIGRGLYKALKEGPQFTFLLAFLDMGQKGKREG